MRILILEDDKVQSSVLQKNLKAKYERADIISCSSIKEAEETYEKNDIDILLLDVELNDENSIDFAEKLVENDNAVSKKIIFTTAHQKYAVNAINRTHCFGYIEKPYDKEELYNIVESCIRNELKIDKGIAFFDFKIRGISHFVNKDHIFFVEFKNKKPILHTQNDVFSLPRMTVNELMEKLSDGECDDFIRCRRDSVVNIKHISHVKKESSINYIVLNNSTTLPIGDKFKEDLFNRLRI